MQRTWVNPGYKLQITSTCTLTLLILLLQDDSVNNGALTHDMHLKLTRYQTTDPRYMLDARYVSLARPVAPPPKVSVTNHVASTLLILLLLPAARRDEQRQTDPRRTRRWSQTQLGQITTR